MGSAAGTEKVAAKRVGLSVADYRARVAAGQKWCTRCRAWHSVSAFGADITRGDGLDAKCLKARSTGRPRGWHERPAINPLTGRPGPAAKPGRDGDKMQARASVNGLVKRGRLPRPNSLPCADCGHEWKAHGDRRHEYDHHLGYAAEYHLKVEPVCAPCHRKREKVRRNG